MTSLISWLSVDAAAPSAIYLASDSRISWKNTGNWDAGRKIFWCKNAPDIFGYCGDVVFPSLVLSQITEAIDAGVLLGGEQDSEQRHDACVDVMKACLKRSQSAPIESFQILHVHRTGSGRSASFRVWQTDFKKKDQSWADAELLVDTRKSSLITALGTGKGAIIDKKIVWEGSEAGGTSRAIFSAFCEAIAEGKDEFSGGPIQLVGMYPSRPPQPFGIISDGERMLNGIALTRGDNANNIEWRDALFQRMDGETMMLMTDAQRHFPRRKRKGQTCP